MKNNGACHNTWHEQEPNHPHMKTVVSQLEVSVAHFCSPESPAHHRHPANSQSTGSIEIGKDTRGAGCGD